MKMKKRIITGAVAMMMAGVMMIPVQADDITQDSTNKSGTTNVTYIEENKYIVTIPSSVELKTSGETTASITASKMNIEPGKKLQVSVSSGISDGKVTLTRTGTDDNTTSTVSLTSGGAEIDDNAVVATFTGQSTNVTGGTLYFSKLSDNLNAGKWSGQIIFQIQVVDKPTN